MKAIIGLYGAANCGKTTTLKKLHDELIKQGGTELKLIQSKGSDYRTIIKYKENIIGIGTSGDDGCTVQENCLFFDKYDCDIAISATRTRGNSVGVLDNYSEEKKLGKDKIIWIKQDSALLVNGEEEADKAQVREIIAKIDELIAKK